MSYLEQVRKLRELWEVKRGKLEREEWWFLYLILHPISFWVTPPFLKIGMTANQVTVVGWITAVAAAVFYGLGGPVYLIVAAAILFVNYLLDLVDGNIARFRDNRTHYGNYLDAIGDAVRFSLCYIGLAIGIQRHLQDYPLAQKCVAYSGDWILLAGAAVAVIFYLIDLYLTHRLDRHRRWIIMQEIEKGKTLQTAWSGKPLPLFVRAAGRMHASFRRLILEVYIMCWCVLPILNMPDWLWAWAVVSTILDGLGGIMLKVLKARYMILYPRP